jgi:hypothetical protein
MRKARRGGFTVIKAVVLLVLFISVAALAFPAIHRVRMTSARRTTMYNLGECAKAAHNAHDAYKKYPPYYGTYGDNPTPMTFHAHLLPYVDQKALYANPVSNAVVPLYLSPMDPTRTNGGAGAANYALNIRLYCTFGGLGTLSPPDNPLYPKMPNSFPDGMSNTLLFATKYQVCGSDGGSKWMDLGNNAQGSLTAAAFGYNMWLWQPAPSQKQCSPGAGTAVSFTADSIHTALCDASVRTFDRGISTGMWAAFHTPGAGDIINYDGWDR